MKNEKWYLDIENVLYQYCVTKERMVRLEEQKRVLEMNLDELYVQINEFKRIPGLTNTYGILKNSSRNGDYDYAALMEEYEQQLNIIVRKIMLKSKKIINIEHRIQEIREWLAPVEKIVCRLSEEEKIIIERKFFDKKSNYQIATILHCSEKRVRTMLTKIITEIATWIGKKKDLNTNTPESHNKRLIAG